MFANVSLGTGVHVQFPVSKLYFNLCFQCLKVPILTEEWHWLKKNTYLFKKSLILHIFLIFFVFFCSLKGAGKNCIKYHVRMQMQLPNIGRKKNASPLPNNSVNTNEASHCALSSSSLSFIKIPNPDCE